MRKRSTIIILAVRLILALTCVGALAIINDTVGALVPVPVLLPMIKRDNRYVRAQITAEELVASEWRPGIATLAAKS